MKTSPGLYIINNWIEPASTQAALDEWSTWQHYEKNKQPNKRVSLLTEHPPQNLR